MRGWTLRLPLAAALLTIAGRAAADTRHFEDATLRAIQFIDDKEGWAVGDEGVVWHTLDSGQSWARQPTGVRASLRSVCFLSAEVGWVAGREELPHGGSAGVLLYTRDGGLKWQRLLTGALPGLNRVCFADAANGCLLADGTDQLPSGLFRTNDGGRTWAPVPGPRTTAWLAGGYLGGKDLLLGGAWARLGTLRGDKLAATADVDQTTGRDIRGVHASPQRALAVAQGGLVLSSVSGGAKWGFADLQLPTEVLRCLDFHAIAAAGSKVWVVGRPGSVVLHSDDNGLHWRLQKTGCPLPLHAACFFNDRLGWAAGEAGTILATRDGGATWKVQRQGGSRAAVLVVHADAQGLPLDTLARLGAADGYLTHALCLVTADPSSAAPRHCADALRYDAAARRAGGLSGTACWAFSLPEHLRGASREQLLDYWNQRHAQQAPREMLRQLVLALRVWRPNVIVGDDPQTKAAAPSLVAEALQEAVRQAGDGKAFPEQIEQLGLMPWQADRVYSLCDRAGATIVQENDESVGALQSTPRKHAAWAAAILGDGPMLLPSQRAFRLLQSQAKGAGGERGMMDGLTGRVGTARRSVDAAEVDAALAQALRDELQMLAQAENLNDPAVVKDRLGPVLAKLPDDHAALAATAVATQALRRGRWDLAREAYVFLVDHYPAHPLAAPAYRWLIRHDSSAEVRRRYELKQFAHPDEHAGGIQQASATVAPGPLPPAAVSDPALSRAWCQSGLDFGKRLAGFGTLFASDPTTQFCLQAARRGTGDSTGPPQWYAKFQGYVPQGPWHDAAQAELWLAGKAPQMPRKLARCRRTDVRPYLDGQLDDPCWLGAKPLVLDNAIGDSAGQYPTQAQFAYDQEYLYVALKCGHPHGKYVAPVEKRERDADLEPFDRVSILLDLDRDYATYFRLEVDQRGCVREDCWGDPGWNPRWFVAVKSDEGGWQIEAAIPLGELSGGGPTLNAAWAFNAVRIVPGRGVQSWSQPADVTPRPEGMSLLLFQQDVERAPAQPMPKAP